MFVVMMMVDVVDVVVAVSFISFCISFTFRLVGDYFDVVVKAKGFICRNLLTSLYFDSQLSIDHKMILLTLFSVLFLVILFDRLAGRWLMIIDTFTFIYIYIHIVTIEQLLPIAQLNKIGFIYPLDATFFFFLFFPLKLNIDSNSVFDI